MTPSRIDLAIQSSGADVRLRPKQALALSMAPHELATNQAKYGALSNAHGREVITWSTRIVEHRSWFTPQWSEHDGPAVKPPDHRGFGGRLIGAGVAYELGGEVRLDFPASGVTCKIDIPVGEAT